MRKILNRIRRGWNVVGSRMPLKTSSVVTNPYVKGAEGQKAWDDRYGNLQQSNQQWRIACLAALLVALSLAGAVAYIATTAKVQPFIVETHEGMPYAITKMTSITMHDQRLMNFTINQFIVNARTVVHDHEAQTALLDKVYAYSANQTLSFLQEHYQKNNPFDIATHATITPQIISSMPLTKDTWQIMWDETEQNIADGNRIKTTRWVANVTVQLSDVNPHFINANPFGLYITQLTWTQARRGESL